jgi:hypothetical protein
MSSVSLLHLLNASMPHNKAFQNKERKAFRSALTAFDADAAGECGWDVGSGYKKVHGGRTSTMEGYCLGTMKGSDGKYHAALFKCKDAQLVPPPLLKCEWGAEPSLKDVVDGLLAVCFFTHPNLVTASSDPPQAITPVE